MLRFASGPDFRPRTLHGAPDADGQPISGLWVAPDGRRVVFQTGASFGGSEQPYNPASLIERPRMRLWSLDLVAGGAPHRLADGVGVRFLEDGTFLYAAQRRPHVVSFDGATPSSRALPDAGCNAGSVAVLRPDEWVCTIDRGGYAYVARIAAGAERVQWLLTGPDRIHEPALSPDGRFLAFLRTPGFRSGDTPDRTASQRAELAILELATGVTRSLWTTRVSSFFGDGALLAWLDPARVVLRAEDDGWDRYYAVDVARVARVALTPTACEAVEAAPLGTQVAISHNCDDVDLRQLGVFDGAGRASTRLAKRDAVAAKPVVAGAGWIAWVGSGSDEPPLVRIADTDGRERLRESGADYGWRDVANVPAPTQVTFAAPDGTRVGAQLFRPAGSTGRHPALVYVHGGPQRQMYAAYHPSRYYAAVYAINRQLASRGYVVLSVNFRSGTGYGRAFREAGGRGWRGASEYQDVLAGAQWLQARPDVDPERIGIWGGSYGGLLTAQALARNSDVFRAGVALHGVFDWSFRSSRSPHLNPSAFFGVGEADRATARAASPVARVDGWRSPVLLIHGDEDANVDVLESVDLAGRLRERDVDVRTMLLPGEAHDFLLQANRERVREALFAFFDEHLGADAKRSRAAAKSQ